jgi:hypothetical protein
VSSREYVASKATRISPPAESDEGTPSTTNSGVGRPLLCTLPPTCNNKPTPLSNTRELESHYATYHAHVCEQPGCGSVFPDARLLELVSPTVLSMLPLTHTHTQDSYSTKQRTMILSPP